MEIVPKCWWDSPLNFPGSAQFNFTLRRSSLKKCAAPHPGDLKHPEVPVTNINFTKNYSTENKNIPLVSDHVPKHKKPENGEEFASYLAGLVEGDGNFSKHGHTVNIAFHINDAPLAYYIKKTIGYSHSLKCQRIFILSSLKE